MPYEDIKVLNMPYEEKERLNIPYEGTGALNVLYEVNILYGVIEATILTKQLRFRTKNSSRSLQAQNANENRPTIHLHA
jgi:hypothetical protein